MVKPYMVSQKCDYALRAIFELALRNTAKPVKTQDIASAQLIPSRFLEVILAELKHAGFVESRRGADGGYILARSANDLTVGEIIRFFQGDTRISGRTDLVTKADIMGVYAFSEMWKKISDAISDTYDNNTFADLIERELAKRKAYVPNYAI